ncbi:nucleotide exchange factor GrpE [Brevundimonas sp. 2R-24]|uniref:Protein GrpE n=1 Tax=Peiella sedimenti TaxID=3061083 RepID=A0ABT8SNK9_9CAUL|nr:nucleotide exchange factor GrpE [Caulobacteraceae bacterium XZ-24]
MTDEFDRDDLPEDEALAPEAEDLEAELAAARAEAEQWRDQALRAVAEAENVKRRTEREMNDARAYAITKFARDLLGVADSLQRALAAAPQSDDAGVQGLVTGLEMTEKALLQAFEGNGLARVAPEPGERFDPNVHQAMIEQPSDSVAAGCVVQTFQPGYSLFGRVVRPAMVAVAAKGSGQAETQRQGAAAYAKATGGEGS